MRCQKCKKPLPLLARFCSGCGTAVVLEHRLKSEWLFIFALTLILGGVMLGSYVFGQQDYSAQTFKALALGFIGVGSVLVLAIVIILFYAFIDLVRLAVHKPKFLPLPILVVALIAGGSYAGYTAYGYWSTFGTSLLLQDCLVEAASSKLMGDKLTQGKKIPDGYSWWRVQASSQRAAQILTNAPTPERLDDYKKSLVVWSAKMADVSKDHKDWSITSAQPAAFSLSVNDSQSKKLFGLTLERMAVLKEFGDIAIKNKDAEAMRYIAARLLVQRHWLHGLAQSQNPGFLAFGLVSPAQAAGERRICVAGAAGADVCAADILENVDAIYATALDVLEGKDKAADAWKDAWEKIAQDKNFVLPKPAEADAKYSPIAQSFVDYCYERGGELGNGIDKRDQLPTDENGITCNFLKEKDDCWALLTNSGSRYGGGEGLCPKENVLPSAIAAPWPVQPAPEPKKQPVQPSAGTSLPKAKAVDWDGNYAMVGTLFCTGNIPDMPPALPINTNVSVSGNSLTDMGGAARKIDGNGRATLSGEGTQNTFKAVYKTTYQFTMEKNVATAVGNASMDMSASENGVDYAAHCAGTVSGTRVGK